jgi:hypothetical protein
LTKVWYSKTSRARERERKRESYAKSLCVDLTLAVMGRAPWCKGYTVPLPLRGRQEDSPGGKRGISAKWLGGGGGEESYS